MLKPVEIVSKLNRLVFSIDLVGYPSHDANWYRARTHKFYSIILITKGKGEFIIDGTLHIAEPGKLFVIVPGMETERRNITDQALEHYIIRFSFVEVFHHEGEWTYHNQNKITFPLQGNYSIQNVPPILLLFEQLYHLWKRKGPMIIMRKNILFQELWLTIVQDLRAQKSVGNTSTAIDLTVDHMANHYREEINLEDLAFIAGISKSHYARLFKKYTGYSPIEYLTHIRIARAKELITLYDYKLKEIANAVGYKDEFYFSRIFKKNVGVSPSEYAVNNRVYTP